MRKVAVLIALGVGLLLLVNMDAPDADSALLAPQTPAAMLLSATAAALAFKMGLLRRLVNPGGLRLTPNIGFTTDEFNPAAVQHPQTLPSLSRVFMQLVLLHLIVWYGFGGWIASAVVLGFLAKWLVVGGAAASDRRRTQRAREQGFPNVSDRPSGANPIPKTVNPHGPTTDGQRTTTSVEHAESVALNDEEAEAWNSLVARLNQEGTP